VERTILELENVMKIIVTHRYNKVLMKRYDELIVLNNGKVIERGNFDTLMKKRGYFYLLYSIANDD
jgi:ATP-binding cassette subfamily C protein